MKLKDLKQILVAGESVTVEFKKSTAQLQSALCTLCAFLNNHGGIVLIGVSNNGKIVGEDVTDNTRQEIARELAKIEPPIQPDVDYILIDNNKYIIAISVASGCHAPYVFDGRSYYRIESSTSKMPQHLYEQLLIERGQLNYSWEELITNHITLDELDHDEITRTIPFKIQP